MGQVTVQKLTKVGGNQIGHAGEFRVQPTGLEFCAEAQRGAAMSLAFIPENPDLNTVTIHMSVGEAQQVAKALNELSLSLMEEQAK